MTISAAKKAAGRKTFKRNPILRKWAMASKQSYADFKADRIPGLKYKKMKMSTLMKNSKYKAHRRRLATK